MVIVLVGLIGSTIAVWADVRIQESDAWADTVGPLADDPVVQEYVVSQASAAIDRQLNADESNGIIQKITREQIGALVRPLLYDFVQSSTYASFWHEANRVAHSALLEVIYNDESDVIKRDGGQLSIDLEPVVEWTNLKLKAIFPDLTYTISLPPELLKIEIYTSDVLDDIGDVIHLIDELARILPVITLIALVGLFVVAEKRGQAMLQLGWAIMATMIGFLLVLTAVRVWLVSQQAEAQQDVVDAVLRILLVDLIRGYRGLAMIGLLLVIAWVATNSNAFFQFLRENREMTTGVVIATAMFGLVATDYPPVWLIILMLVIIVAGLVAMWKWRNENRQLAS